MSSGGGVVRFIVLEGLDGTGKTTVALRLRDALGAVLSAPPLFTREPSVEFARVLRRESDQTVRLFWYLLDRASHVRRIEEALRSGRWVVCDRYYHSTLVYNAVPVGEGLWGEEEFERFVRWAARGLEPHLVLWLDCSEEVCLARLASRGGTDPMGDLELLRRARMRYEQVMPRFGNVVRVDASLPLDAVVNRCLEAIWSLPS